MSEKDRENDQLRQANQVASGFCYLCEQIKNSDVVALQLLSPRERETLQQGDSLLEAKYARLGLNHETTPMDFRAQLFDEVATNVSGYREVVLKHTGNMMALIDRALSK